jgi:hypothetical protein
VPNVSAALHSWAIAAAQFHTDPSPLASACLCTRRTQARYLKFCQDYNPRACCIPGHDLENQVQFENLISALGPGCKNPMMYPEVRFFYCLGCDPDQPKYTIGDTIRVCKSFLDRMWRDPAFDECGVMYSNPCPAAWGDDADFDPYMCGDSLLLPRQTYNDNPTAFINVFKPPGLDDFNFVSIDGEAARAHDGQRTSNARHARTIARTPPARLWLWAHTRLPALPLSLTHTHSLTHSLTHPLSLSRPTCLADTIVNGQKVDPTECWVANVYRSDSSSPAPRLSASWGLTAGTVALGLVLQSLLR